MATLYTHQSSNVRKTWILFTAFFGIVIGLGWIFSQIYRDPGILILAVLFSAGMSIASYWYSDKLVLAMAHAEPVNREGARELYTIIENLTITAGLPMPKIYIINDPAPNAFATGRNKQHAVVAVTNGLLEQLNKTELEGVLAHELSHIGNKDMLVSTVAVVLVGFISLAADFFMRTLWFGGGRNRDERGGNSAIFIIGIVLSILAPIAATLLRLAISRKREFLADASGVLLTRYPEGLASALFKISDYPRSVAVAQNTTAHLWIADPFKGKNKTLWLHKLFMTHPPAEERIKILREMSV